MPPRWESLKVDGLVAVFNARASAADLVFDSLLPAAARKVSRRYWTPASVVQRVVDIIREHGSKRALDVGSGPGKFCILGGGLARDIEFVGVEHRADLVDVAVDLARRTEVMNASFRVGDATRICWSDFDALYVFNSFAENLFPSRDRFDESVELSRRRYIDDILRVATKLTSEPAEGTILVTYHGLGGPIPERYKHLSAEQAGTGWLHVWRYEGEDAAPKSGVDASFWLEDDESVRLVSAEELHALLEADHLTTSL